MGKKVDETDMKIIAYLGLDARLSSKKIGEKIGLSTKTVSSRIKNLEKNGVILTYIVMCDCYNFGYKHYIVDLKLKNDTKEIRKEITNYLTFSPNTWWVSEAIGHRDLTIVFYTKKYDGFFDLWMDLKKKFQRYIQDSEISPVFGHDCSLIMPTKKLLKERKVFKYGNAPPYKLSKEESEILTLLVQKGRMHLSDIAKQIKVPLTSVKYKIDRLKKKGIILGSTVVFDWIKLGFELYLLDFYLNSMDRVEDIEKMIIDQENSWHLLKATGRADIRCTIFSKDQVELDQIINQIKDSFPGQIRKVGTSQFKAIFKAMPYAVK
jgi:DNA-binding Lrp family transcriptional regulator